MRDSFWVLLLRERRPLGARSLNVYRSARKNEIGAFNGPLFAEVDTEYLKGKLRFAVLSSLWESERSVGVEESFHGAKQCRLQVID